MPVNGDAHARSPPRRTDGGTAPPASAGGRSATRTPSAASASTAASRWSESTSKVTRPSRNCGLCTPSTSAMRSAGNAVSAMTVVRVRCRSSASEPLCDHPAGPDDADPVGQRLGLGQDVRAEQHGRALVLQLEHGPLELRLHQRVESRGRFVEQVELGPAGEGGDQGHLLAVALGVGAGLLARVELEALEHLRPALLVETTPHAPQDVDHLTAGQVRPQVHVARDVGDPAMQLGRLPPRVAAEQRGACRRRP